VSWVERVAWSTVRVLLCFICVRVWPPRSLTYDGCRFDRSKSRKRFNQVSDEGKVRSRMKTSRKVSRIVGVGAALLAVVAFSAIALASSASAAIVYLLAEWLNKGIGLTSTVLGESVTEILLEDTKVPAALNAAVSVNCKGRLDGDFGPDGADDVTEVLTETGSRGIPLKALEGEGLSCAKEALCESGKVWAVNLPWLTLLELWEEGTQSGFVVLLTGISGPVGWYVECTILGVKAEDECLALEGAVAEAPKNLTEGVEAIFSETVNTLFGFKLATCSQSSAETGVVEAKGIIRLPTGGPLAASE
jgi:hypothetical protein